MVLEDGSVRRVRDKREGRRRGTANVEALGPRMSCVLNL